MELNVQKYLRSGGTLSSLRGEPYNLAMQEKGDLVLLKYIQGASDFNNPIVRECRGIILFKPTWDVVAYPFNKFFNWGEEWADQLDMSELHVYEKVDGSLAKVWYFEGSWRLSSNGGIDASVVNVGQYNFQSLFMRALDEYGLTWEQFTSELDTDYTYMYELVTENNIVIIPHKGFHLYYLGQRNIHTFQEEYNPDTRIENVAVYDFKTIDDVVNAAAQLGDDAEGYVIRDNHWNRVKVKNPRYFLMHGLFNNGKPNLLEAVINRNESELLCYFPQFETEVKEIQLSFKKLCQMANYFHKELSNYYSLSRKEFAQSVFRRVPVYLQSYVFSTYENREMTWEEYTQNWDIYRWKNIYERASTDIKRMNV